MVLKRNDGIEEFTLAQPYSVTVLEAVARLLEAAEQDTGQGRRAADFLFAWHDAKENGGWDPTDLWQVPEQISRDMLTVLGFLAQEHTYADELGFEREIAALWKRWKGDKQEF